MYIGHLCVSKLIQFSILSDRNPFVICYINNNRNGTLNQLSFVSSLVLRKKSLDSSARDHEKSLQVSIERYILSWKHKNKYTHNEVTIKSLCRLNKISIKRPKNGVLFITCIKIISISIHVHKYLQ